MFTTKFPYILLWVITKRASGITVASRHIPQFTSSNNFELMKCDLETTRMLSHASYLGPPVDITVIWRCTSPPTIFSSVSIGIMFVLRTWYICLFRLTTIRDEHGRPLSASNASSNVVLLRRKDFLEIDVRYSSDQSFVGALRDATHD